MTLHIHHVGGRDGEIGHIIFNDHFSADYHVTAYDADESCLPQVIELNRSRGRNVSVVAAIIAEADTDEAAININYCPCSSSTLESADFPPDCYSSNKLLGDYLFRDTFRTVRQIRGPARSIDSLCAEREYTVNVLSIDTQGTESLIIEGAHEQLRRNGIAVLCEVEFREMYKGQALFEDLVPQMREAGFMFIRTFDSGARTNFFRGAMGWRADGVMMSGDALFIKDLDRIEIENDDVCGDLLRLAFLALHYDYVEIALDAATRAFKRHKAVRRINADSPGYLGFIWKFYHLYESTLKFNMPAMTELFTHEQALKRFDAGGTHPWLHIDVAQARQNYLPAAELPAFLKALPALISEAPAPLENLLIQHGFKDLAEQVKSKRIEHVSTTLKLLRLLRQDGDKVVLDIGDYAESTSAGAGTETAG